MFISHQHKIAYFSTPRTGSRYAQYVLEHSQLPSREDDVITNLDEIESLDIDWNTDLSNRDSLATRTFNQYHLTPTQAIEQGLITLEQLREYTSFTFVRDPLDRWVSKFMWAKSLGLWEGDNIDVLTLAIRHGLFHGRNDYAIDFKWNYHDYFYHNDELVLTPYKLESMDTVLSTIVGNAGGFAETNVPQRYIDNHTPDYLKLPIATWLPEDCIDLLHSYFALDIEFYESLD